ncbi:MAG: VWA domain-containing protein [Acidobacteriota bacterium]
MVRETERWQTITWPWCLSGRSSRFPRAFLALLAFTVAIPGVLFAEADGAATRLLVEVLDTKGQLPVALAPGDLEVREGGVSRPLTALEGPSFDRGRVVLYFDPVLSSSGHLKRAAGALANVARQLTELGEIEVVSAAEAPDVTLKSREELVVGEKLSRSALTETGDRQILELRQRVLRDLRLASPAAAILSPDQVAETVIAGIEEEIELIRQRQDLLLAWASQPGVSDSRLLVLVVDGFDLDPVGFYVQRLQDEARRAVIRETARLETLADPVRDTASALAAVGWTVLPIVLAGAGDEAGLEYAPIAIDSGGQATSAPGVTLRPGSLFGRRKEAEPEIPPADFLEPLEPLRLLAEASGGEVIVTEQGLRDALRRFAGRFQLTYDTALPVEAGLESIDIRPLRSDLRVRATRWLGRGVPEKVAAVRLARLLAGAEADGGFDVAAVLKLNQPPESGQPSTAQLEARLGLRDLREAGAEDEVLGFDQAVYRVTLAITAPGAATRLEREIVRATDLEDQAEWLYRTEVEIPPNATEVGVLVEDLETGSWGGRRATVVQGDWALADADLLPPPSVLEILEPTKNVLRGRTRFETEIYDSRVAQVDFLLDDRQVASRDRTPFTARVDLGKTPRRRTLTAVAFDSANNELGRDSLVLNGGAGGLDVRIVQPRSRRGTGWVEVEANVEVPLEQRLDRVIFFWNNKQVATVYSAPFKQRVFIDQDKPVGYVRVVALLADGTLAEDVAFMNGPDHGERLEVNLVELYVVVTDDRGRPVRGLTEQEFRIREDGVPQDIATFSDAEDLPLTLGMAIDSSASMFVKLPAVQSAASNFLRSTFSEQDRAFVVDFDSEPRLARSTTGSLDRILTSIGGLEASGRTALWESIVFSLVQLQGVRGRKALVVFSDGADEDDQFPFRSSFSVAKKMGVPIYLILMRKSPKRGSGMSLMSRSFESRVNRIVETTGGRVYYAKDYNDLDQVYAKIERELRSQYLLAYYPREPSRGESWRTVDVDVEGDGLRPRTLQGYWD